MSLLDLCDNSKTDKNTTHSYLELYEKLLNNKKYNAKNVLEIGVKEGGSIKLWHDYFENANIYGLDIIPIKYMWDEITNKERIKLGCFDAYNDSFFNEYFLNKIKFDFVLDDGPHTLESMIQFIKLYSSVLTDDGILIIEDVQSIDWIEILKNEVPEDLIKFIEFYDLRNIKNRYDDIVFVINKTKK
uniref:Methyltransferase n=1 Tax=viral metagenome TaxID=1070528 RepID=A0A6C0KXX7_9ZZZZ